ncbi:hypothetical protein EVJ58_g1956 [Rhodofomes roseus]|uniref:Uncharacterized protein n=1 Tax=Rhodofomes roseus TaxID=34475 RepID=A0A4Y9YUS9_9APHY|nr:hypothetical protein EVJ58_g1956 [Rhodofomes roseus]
MPNDRDLQTYISQADHDTLCRLQNSTYQARLQQIEHLNMEKTELLTYKKLYNDLITRIPPLIGLAQGTYTAPSIPDAAVSATAPSRVPKAAPWASHRVTLGLGLTMPAVPRIPSGIRYRTREDWNSAQKGKPAKQGPQPEGLNVAQRFIEEANGEPVSGYVAKEARLMLHSLLHSLLWSGQASPSAQTLGHEARVYLHVNLSARFPMLLYCEEGAWKIDYLISQLYPGFTKTYNTAAKRRSMKHEPMDTVTKIDAEADSEPEVGCVVPTKRSADTQDTAASAPPGPKKPRTTSAHWGPQPASAAPVTNIASPVTNVGASPVTNITAPVTNRVATPMTNIAAAPVMNIAAAAAAPVTNIAVTNIAAGAPVTNTATHSLSAVSPAVDMTWPTTSDAVAAQFAAGAMFAAAAVTGRDPIHDSPKSTPQVGQSALPVSDRITFESTASSRPPSTPTHESQPTNATAALSSGSSILPSTFTAAAPAVVAGGDLEAHRDDSSNCTPRVGRPQSATTTAAAAGPSDTLDVTCSTTPAPQVDEAVTDQPHCPFIPLPKPMPPIRRSKSPPTVVVSQSPDSETTTAAATNDTSQSSDSAGDPVQTPGPSHAAPTSTARSSRTRQTAKPPNQVKASTERKPDTINERQIHLAQYIEAHGEDTLLCDWEKAYKKDRKDEGKLTALRADVDAAKAAKRAMNSKGKGKATSK